jgi:tetratricopeptide (TPR) repeat protein
MRLILFLLILINLAFSNYYYDYLMCRYLSASPAAAQMYCLRAVKEKPTPSLYMDTIRLLMASRKVNKALDLSKEYLKKFPSKPEPYIAIYSIHRLRGNRKEALRILERAYRRFPDHREILIFLADEYIKAKKMEKAKNVLHRFAKVSPDNPFPYYLLGQLYLSEGKTNKAIEYLQKALEIKKTFEAAFVTLGRVYEKREEHASAENLYKSILKEDPDNSLALEKLAQLYVAMGRVAEARRIYRKLLNLYPENYQYRHQYAITLMQSGDFYRAREVLEEIYRNHPNDLNVAYSYALSLELTGELKDALSIYEGLYKKVPNNSRVIERLANVYMGLGMHDKAEELIKKGLFLNPASVKLHMLKANLLMDREKYRESLGVLDRVISINPKEYRAYFLKAIALDFLGRIVEAEENLKKAMELQPEDPDLYNHLGYSLLIWYGSERIEEAQDLIRKALAADPNNPAYIDSMGWVYYLKGDYEKAIQYLLDALRRAYDDPVVNEHVGDVLMKMGYPETALEYYRKSLQLLDEGKQGEKGQRQRLLEKLGELYDN